MSDPRSILILYGSQSGNSEDIAIQTGKAAVEHNLFCLLYTSPSPRDRG